MARTFTATYRLQLNAGFTLHDARARVPYLHRLGISHLYCSPVLTARPGSTHGYDVTDPTSVSAELGGEEALVALAESAHERGMGLVLDIVPNHMGVGADNPYWEDLLVHGPASRYASWFDVDWRATGNRLGGKVLVPVLADTLERVLERGEITLEQTERGMRLRYFDHSLPVNMATAAPERGLAELLAAQHYELAFWRTAQRDVNYRRFFDVNDLISLRVEQEDVFLATHRTVLRLVSAGHVDGIRVDHIDGLLEPRRYLERLRASVDACAPRAAGDERMPIFVEKILAAGEVLPADWPVEGTTGYEILTVLEDLFIDPEGYAALEARYRRAGHAGFQAIASDAKRRVLRGGLNADVRRVAPMLAALARAEAWPACTIADYAGAIVELTAALPVYRTYIDAVRPDPSDADRIVLLQAFAIVRARGVARAEATLALERALLREWGRAAADVAAMRLAFVLRWQQLSGPAAAKGVEDTALYIYAPLASRNEVGGDPGQSLDGAAQRLHNRLAERAARHPRALNATNTHDTKRSADVRARLDAISQHALRWRRRLRHWRRHHRELRTLAGGRLAPTRTTDNFIYQSLVGIWPMEGGPSRDSTRAEDARQLELLRDRLAAYIQKAVREAKLSTSWTDPDAEYEAAVRQFITGLLDRSRSADFLREMEQFVALLAPQGAWNALSRIVVHLMAPGIPDLYQGDELWYQALVDPDNRRPVDWAARDEALDMAEDADAAQLADWVKSPGSGLAKLAITTKILRWRRSNGPLLSLESYTRAEVVGAKANQTFAFERAGQGGRVLVVATRLTDSPGGMPPIGRYWEGGTVTAGGADGATWCDIVTGRTVISRAGRLPLEQVLASLPAAVLVQVPPDGASSRRTC